VVEGLLHIMRELILLSVRSSQTTLDRFHFRPDKTYKLSLTTPYPTPTTLKQTYLTPTQIPTPALPLWNAPDWEQPEEDRASEIVNIFPLRQSFEDLMESNPIYMKFV